MNTHHLTASDARAFNLWGAQVLSRNDITPDPEDRALQHDFWKRYIGNSRLRLVRSFGIIFLPHGIYEESPQSFVENKLDVETIRQLYEQLPQDGELSESDRNSETRLGRFLRGDYKNGIGFNQLREDSDKS